MRVPYSWLREYCDPGVGVEEIAERLVMTGTEVERIGAVGPPDAEGFVVGKVVGAEQHPNADRLRVCSVETGDGERTIVCGAPNVAAGQTVAVALPGARMPGGEKLRKAKLRGVASEGMILSVSELEIGADADGILELEAGPAPGTPLAEVLPLAESVLELEVTPNRSDCFGVRGAAGGRALGRGRACAGGGAGRGLRLGDGRGAGALPALHRSRLHRRRGRSLAALAAGAADRGGPAADQQRG
jgi:phenylalanyl-tRNA synthetase beta chain